MRPVKFFAQLPVTARAQGNTGLSKGPERAIWHGNCIVPGIMSTGSRVPFFIRFLLAFAACMAVTTAAARESRAPQGLDRGDAVACADAARTAERDHKFPLAVMRAIALAESSRWLGAEPARIAWPWTVTAGGDGRYFATKAEAIAHVRALRRDGVRNIDVGCMQINLMHHPDAFESLQHAFDPNRNAAYAAAFLARLYDKSRSWSHAIGLYHSATPDKGQRYRRRVEKLWDSERARLFEEARQARILTFRARRAAGLTRSR
jgi:hypothetical protein